MLHSDWSAVAPYCKLACVPCQAVGVERRRDAARRRASPRRTRRGMEGRREEGERGRGEERGKRS